MKKVVFLLCFLLSYASLKAQETYSINGETLQLKLEIEGRLDLLWNIIDGEYRYFVRTTDNNIMELVNTKDSQNNYQEQYKTTLEELTNDSNLSTAKLNLTLYSLKTFIDAYNQNVDASYQSDISKRQVQLRLGFFGGITNSPFVGNPKNKKTGQFGGELEFVETSKLSRHAIFTQLKHVLKTDDFQYSTTELSLGYRFRFVNAEKFSLYANMKFATLNFSNATVSFLDENDALVTRDISETAFDVPFIFGVGADIKISENSFITLAYNELFAILLDNQGNFSTDFSIGYKFNL